MNFDLVLLAVVALFTVVGALRGAARQLAQLAALVVAYVGARSAGTALGPHLVQEFGFPLGLTVLLSTLGVFLPVYLTFRYAMTIALRSLFSGATGSSGLDRVLGALLGGLKATLACYIVLSALAYVEGAVQVRGGRLRLVPEGSLAMAFATRYNLFDLPPFTTAKALFELARSATDPSADDAEAARRLKTLKSDPRVKRLLESKEMKDAISSGSWHKLLTHPTVLELAADPKLRAKLLAK